LLDCDTELLKSHISYWNQLKKLKIDRDNMFSHYGRVWDGLSKQYILCVFALSCDGWAESGVGVMSDRKSKNFSFRHFLFQLFPISL